MKLPRTSLLTSYADLLRTEPRARSYLLACVADDLGIAIAGWAFLRLQTTLWTTQRARASVMLPALVAFLIGSVISGPLADWTEHRGAAALAQFRHRVLLGGRTIETLALGLLVVSMALGPPTLLSVLPYFVISALMKTALRPTRLAFATDLLQEQRAQVDASGRPLCDERGDPLVYKAHLFACTSLIDVLRLASALGGLVAGGLLQRWCAGIPWLPFLLDVLTNVAFIVIVAARCRPAPEGSAHAAAVVPALPAAPSGAVRRVVVAFGRSARDGLRFLVQPAQRPLLWLLAGTWLFEVVTETYNGNMIMKHVLGGTDDQVRYAEMGWIVAGLVATALLPLLGRRLGSLGKLFLVLAAVDALVMVAAGAAGGARRPILAFTLALGADRALGSAAGGLVALAMASASSTRMRGRIEAAYALLVIVGDMAAEGLSTVVSEAIGILPMLVRAGWFQLGAVVLIGIVGGQRLWRFGLFATDATAPAAPRDEQAPALALESSAGSV